jgi:hypothetical protein
MASRAERYRFWREHLRRLAASGLSTRKLPRLVDTCVFRRSSVNDSGIPRYAIPEILGT